MAVGTNRNSTINRSTPYDELPQWLSPKEAASALGLSTWAVYKQVHTGEIPFRRVGPKLIQIPKTVCDFANASRLVIK